jgi:gamma-glutamyltranspeptidase / glutathione hydrolase
MLPGLLCLFVMSAATLPSLASQAVLQYDQRQEIFQPISARGGMVASDHVLASEIGAAVLASGGNAIDAAVATGFALAVVLPSAGNLGGGGFMLVHHKESARTVALDFREVAPSLATATMFLDHKGEPVPGMSVESTAAIGVPGSVAGLLHAWRAYASMSRAELIAPAISLARDGFTVSESLARLLQTHRDHLYKSPANRPIFFVKRSSASSCEPLECPLASLRTLRAGERLVQSDLANTLQLISDHGEAGFYQGSVANAIVQTVNQGEIRMTVEDLGQYKVIEREPLFTTYRGVSLATMPPPSSGGVHLIQMLNTLETFPMASLGYASAATIHRITEAARVAYADRATHLGDPAFHRVPVEFLLSKDYARERLETFEANRARTSVSIKAGVPPAESKQTTHYSVADKDGNLVSTTTTLNLNFGSGWMASGTGVLLNNEMDDFSLKPGVPNAYGLLGNQANAIAPGKRPLSSMSPTILFRNGQPWIATGSPGGARIITTVLQFVLNVTDFSMNIASAASVPRMHHQWMPDQLLMEPGFSPDTIALLQAMGHDVRASRAFGRLQSVAIEADRQLGASDPRSSDGAAVGVID